MQNTTHKKAETIVARYQADTLGYDSAIVALMKLGMSEARADGLLVPRRKLSEADRRVADIKAGVIKEGPALLAQRFSTLAERKRAALKALNES